MKSKIFKNDQSDEGYRGFVAEFSISLVEIYEKFQQISSLVLLEEKRQPRDRLSKVPCVKQRK